ncbi:MAG: DUF1549 domain-containing protein [Planctomycetota bacterium]|nr:DUF1549 domain-containing protein [Planctomycetota bacterium]
MAEEDAPSEDEGIATAKAFDAIVAPLLARRCLGCHNSSALKGKLDLSRRDSALRGGENGRVIVPGKPEESRLWEYVLEGEMPPRKPLPGEEKRVIRRWIARGAVWGTSPIDVFRYTTEKRAGHDWWSLAPLRRPPLPPVAPGWARTPIDRFILARLEKKKLRPSPAAGRRALIRRLSFDLTGLPPGPADVEAFVEDPSPIAYEKLVDRLLSSPTTGSAGPATGSTSSASARARASSATACGRTPGATATG